MGLSFKNNDKFVRTFHLSKLLKWMEINKHRERKREERCESPRKMAVSKNLSPSKLPVLISCQILKSIGTDNLLANFGNSLL